MLRASGMTVAAGLVTKVCGGVGGWVCGLGVGEECFVCV